MSTATTKPQAPAQVVAKDQNENGKSLLDKVIDATLQNKLREVDEYAVAIENAEDHLQRSLLISGGIKKLRGLLTGEVMDSYVMPLMNSPLGFLTDRDPSKGSSKPPYDTDTVRECAIAALLAGLHLAGNEWNIIGGRMMPVKDGWRRKVRQIPGVKEADVVIGSCQVDGAIAKVRVVAWAKIGNTVKELLDQERKPGRTIQIPIKSAQYESVDTWKGKAERRAWKALWEHLTNGVSIADGEEDIPLAAPVSDEATEGTPPPSKADALADKLAGRGKPVEQPAPEKDPDPTPETSTPSQAELAEQDAEAEAQRLGQLMKAAKSESDWDFINGEIAKGSRFGDMWVRYRAEEAVAIRKEQERAKSAVPVATAGKKGSKGMF